MTKEIYLKELENIAEQRKKLDELQAVTKQKYIDFNAPCSIGDEVMITLASGRKVEGICTELGILKDKNVHVTAYKVGSKQMYITVPNVSVDVLYF